MQKLGVGGEYDWQQRRKKKLEFGPWAEKNSVVLS